MRRRDRCERRPGRDRAGSGGTTRSGAVPRRRGPPRPPGPPCRSEGTPGRPDRTPSAAGLAPVAGGHLVRAGDQGRVPQAAASQGDEGGHVDLADGGPGARPAQEAELVDPQVAEAGQVPLVEQRGSDRSAGLGLEAPDRLRRVPVGAERVRTEVADRVGLLRGRQDLDDRQVEPVRRRRVIQLEEHAHLVHQPPGQPLARAHHRPAARHLEVRVQGHRLAARGDEAGQLVLAVRVDPRDGRAAKVERRVGRDPQLGPDEAATHERRLQAPGQPIDRVSLGHRSSVRGLKRPVPVAGREASRAGALLSNLRSKSVSGVP